MICTVLWIQSIQLISTQAHTKAKKQGLDVGVSRLRAAAEAIKEGYKVREFERVERPNGLTFIRKRRIDTQAY